MTIEHKDILEVNLHEPKGVSTAVANKVYVSDGAGSGAWKAAHLHGFEDFNDSGTVHSLTNGVFVDLTNDGAGAFTNETHRIPDGRGAIWDVSTNQFEWENAGLALGDTVDIRFDVSVTSNTNNDEFTLQLDMAHGHANAYSLKIFDEIIKTAGTKQYVVWYSVYMGDTDTLENPAKLSMESDSSGDTVVVNGFYVRTMPMNPVYI